MCIITLRFSKVKCSFFTVEPFNTSIFSLTSDQYITDICFVTFAKFLLVYSKQSCSITLVYILWYTFCTIHSMPYILYYTFYTIRSMPYVLYYTFYAIHSILYISTEGMYPSLASAEQALNVQLIPY